MELLSVKSAKQQYIYIYISPPADVQQMFLKLHSCDVLVMQTL